MKSVKGFLISAFFGINSGHCERVRGRNPNDDEIGKVNSHPTRPQEKPEISNKKANQQNLHFLRFLKIFCFVYS